VLLDLGRLTEADREFETAEEVLVAAGGGKITRQLIAVRLERADTLQSLGRLNESVEVLDAAERDVERLVTEAQPGTPLLGALRVRQNVWASLAVLYDNPSAPSLDQPQRALAYRDKLRTGWEHLIALDPNNDFARTDLAVCDSETALTLLKLDPAGAVAVATQGLALFEQLAQTRADDLHLAFRSARASTRLALALLAAGRAAEGLPRIESSVRKHRDLLAGDDNPLNRSSLVWSLTVQGRVEQALGHGDRARAALEEAARLAEPLFPTAELASLRVAAEAYQAYAAVSGGDERCRALGRAQEIWDAWNAGSSPWVDARRKEAAQLVAGCGVKS
jgi:tetratricopeptide (TPR) repeat protein